MGTEPLSRIYQKIKCYKEYCKTTLIRTRYNSYPVLILFAANSPKRLEGIRQEACRALSLEGKSVFIFLNLEDLDCKNLLSEPVIQNVDRQEMTLYSILKKRYSLLTFRYTIEKAIKEKVEPGYDIQIVTKYSEVKDFLFPVKVNWQDQVYILKPDGFLRIWKIYHAHPNHNEALFTLILDATVLTSVQLQKAIKPYEAFLACLDHRENIIKNPKNFGVMILVKSEKQFSDIYQSLQEAKEIKNRMRIVYVKDCGNIRALFYKKVWFDIFRQSYCWFSSGEVEKTETPLGDVVCKNQETLF